VRFICRLWVGKVEWYGFCFSDVYNKAIVKEQSFQLLYNYIIEYIVVGHLYVLKIEGGPKLSPVALHVWSSLVRIEICIERTLFCLREIFPQTESCLLSMTETIYLLNLLFRSNLIYQVTSYDWLHRMLWVGKKKCLLHIRACAGLPGNFV